MAPPKWRGTVKIMGIRNISKIRLVKNSGKSVSPLTSAADPQNSLSQLSGLLERLSSPRSYTMEDALNVLKSGWHEEFQDMMLELFRTNAKLVQPIRWGGTGQPAEQIISDIFSYDGDDYRLVLKHDKGEVKASYLSFVLITGSFIPGNRDSELELRSSRLSPRPTVNFGTTTSMNEDLWLPFQELVQLLRRRKGKVKLSQQS